MFDLKAFESGVDDFRPVLMWFWNDRIEKEEIRKQVDEFASRKIYQFFIHPLSGMEERYLSDSYFDLIEEAASYAKKKNMKLWIYDEYNWPSGNVGGTLIRDDPEYRMVVVRHRHHTLYPGQKGSFGFEGRLVSVQSVCGNVVREIASEGEIDSEKKTFSWCNQGPYSCQVIIFYEEKQRGVMVSTQMSPDSRYDEGYLDTLNPAAVRRFLDLTHERYAERVGGHFGETIMGVFTDEPALTNPFDCGPDTIPWTRHFDKLFFEMNGYDLVPLLAELVMETGNYRRTRYDYWKTLTERFSHAYAGQVKQWCEEHHLLLTGHCCAEEHLLGDLLQTGDTFSFMKHFHIPGIDSIFSKTFLQHENFNFAGKMVAGIAEHTGASRALCETYTGSGWDMTLEEMKRIFNRLAVLGVNMIQFMGAYYSLRGLRKQMPAGYPPSHSFQSPLWPYYGLFSDYISRICYAASCGTHGADIAVLLPTSTVWSDYALCHDFLHVMGPEQQRPYGKLTIVERTLHGVTNALLQSQRDFDLLPCASLLEAEIVGDSLHFKGHYYRTLIIPSLYVLTAAECNRIISYIDAGGFICFLNFLPSASPDDGPITGLRERIGANDSSSAEEMMIAFAAGAASTTSVNRRRNIAHIMTNELKQNENGGFLSALKETLSDNPQPLELKEPCPHVFIHHRKQSDQDLFVLVNDYSSDYTGGFLIRRAGVVSVHDPQTGATSHLSTIRSGDGVPQTVYITLKGLQALVLQVY